MQDLDKFHSQIIKNATLNDIFNLAEKAQSENYDIHLLKTIDPFFSLVWEGRKLFEWRKFDRDFKPFDELVLQNYRLETVENLNKVECENSIQPLKIQKSQVGYYLPRKIHCEIDYIMCHELRHNEIVKDLRISKESESLIMPIDGIPTDFCLMAIRILSRFVFADRKWQEIRINT